MNKKITLLAILFLATVSSIFSAPQVIEKTKVSIVDYKNKNKGEPIPQWVKEVAMGNIYDVNIFRDVPNFNKHQNDDFFVISKRGNDFEKLITKSENDMKHEYSSIIQRRIGKAMASKNSTYHESNESLTPTITIDNPSKFSILSSAKITEDATHFLQCLKTVHILDNASDDEKRFTVNYTLGELPSYVNKFCDFWISYEVTNNNNEVVDSYYDYFLVYTADKKSYDSEMENALSYATAKQTINNFSLKVKTPTDFSLFDKYLTVIDMGLDINGNITNAYIDSSVPSSENTSSSDIIPIFSHTRETNIQRCRKDSLQKDILTRFDLVLPKEKITPLVKNKNELVVEVYNNDEYMCTDYFCVYELNKKDITKAMKSYY